MVAFHTIKLTKKAAEALNSEKTLKDKTYSVCILRILKELANFRKGLKEIQIQSDRNDLAESPSYYSGLDFALGVLLESEK